MLRADARRNREAIVCAARELFAEKGMDAQMDEIARRAKVGVGTVYRHFPAKEDLLDGLITRRFERLAERAAEAVDTASQGEPWEAFRGFIEWSAGLQAGDRALSEAMATRSERMHDAAVASGLITQLERLLELGAAGGRTPRGPRGGRHPGDGLLDRLGGGGRGREAALALGPRARDLARRSASPRRDRAASPRELTTLRAVTGVLEGLSIVEGSAYVAAPLGGMTLAQLGADVVRFDDIGGGLDHTRWPLAQNGESLFWAGLNKGKRSLRVNLRSDEGRELVSEVIAAAGAFLTNFPARGWLSYETLRARRDDLIMVHLKGNRDGSSEVDYTVNPATGFPWATGPRNLTEPLNSVLPAWDIAMGELAAIGLLAADRHRTRTGEGQLVETALSDVAFAVTGHLGRVAQAQLDATDSPRRDGNYLYGAFGHDFVTRDERHVMVVALTTANGNRCST